LPGKVIDDVLGIVGDAFAFVVIDDGDDVAIHGAAVNRAEFVFKKHHDPLFCALAIAAFDLCKLGILEVSMPRDSS
jgi:hypothetical protein